MIGALRVLEPLLQVMLVVQPPDTAWTLTAGSDADEWCRDAILTTRHELVCAGVSEQPASGRDAYVISVDSSGELNWERHYGGAAEDLLLCAAAGPKGELTFGGTTTSSGSGERDCWVFQTDRQGQVLWEKTYGGPERDVVNHLCPMPDGGYMVIGKTRSFSARDADAWILRISGTGDSLWSRTLGGIDYDDTHGSVPTPDGGVIFVGETSSWGEGRRSGWAAKLSADGDSLWSRDYGGALADFFYDIAPAADGAGYIIAGHTESFGAGSYDGWLVRIDESGDFLWSRTYGGREEDLFYAVRPTLDGSYIAVGKTYSFAAGAYDIWMIKVSAAGDSLWSRTFGGVRRDNAWSVMQTVDSSFWITGYTSSRGAGNRDAWIIKTTPDTTKPTPPLPVAQFRQKESD